MEGGPRELTFVFTDIEGSTALFQRLGDTYIEVLDAHHAVMREALAAHGGTEVQTEGDAFFITFPDAADALAACLQAQEMLAAATFAHGEPVKVRMGLHRGLTRVTSTDEYVGIALHEAARIASTAHGGQIVLSDDVAAQADGRLPDGASLLDLGTHALKDFPVPRQLYQLVHPNLRPTFPPLRSLTARDHNLWVPPTAIVGRDDDVAAIVDLLTSGSRLVTITGEGGLGKTRLAVECAWQLVSWCKDGVWFVDLSTLDDSAGIVGTVAGALRVELGAQDPLQAVVERIGNGVMLLVVDNLEQVLDGVTVLSELLGECSNLRILATSRERLRLRGEHRYSLEPLGVPATADPEAVAASATAQLFLDRAAALGHEIAVTADHAPHLAAVCQQLDGLPLAIELAAARLDDFSLPELAGRLSAAIDLLTEGDRDLPPRQQTLRSAIAWSEDLLGERERAVFRACSVFRGPFEAGAAARVADLDADEARTALAAVVAAGLARPHGPVDAAQRRWTYLVPIRQYASAVLERSGDEAGVRDRFVDVMLELAEGAVPRMIGPEQTATMDRLADDHANLRAAIDVAEPERGMRLGAALARYFNYRGHWREGRAILESLWQAGASDAEARSRVGIGLATLHLRLRDLDEALGTLDAVHDELDGHDLEATTLVHNVYALALLEQAADRGEEGDGAYLDEVQFHVERAEAAVEQTDRDWLQALVLHTRASVLYSQRRFSAAADRYGELAERWRELGDPVAELDARAAVAYSLNEGGRLDDAISAGLTALEGARRVGNRHSEALILAMLASAAWATGDRRGAGWAERGSDLAEELGDPWLRSTAALWADDFAKARGDSETRFKYLERVIRAAREAGFDEHVADGEGELAQLRADRS